MTDAAGAGPTRTEELRELATAYLRDDDIATYCTNLIKVRMLARSLGSEDTLNAFVTMVKVVYNGSNMVRPPWSEVKDYLADLKRAVKRALKRTGDTMVARIENIEQMLTSESPRLVIIALLLRHRRGRIWFDDFINQIMTDWRCDRSEDVIEPRPVVDEQMRKIMVWAMGQDIETLGHVSMNVVTEAVAYAADLDRRDMLLDHVNGLPQWDGVERLDVVTVQAFGCEIDDEGGQTAEYLKAVGRNTFISLIARAKEPGVKADFMPIFMGQQGTFKSTAMAIIGGKFHGEIHESLNSNDFYLGLQGIWVAEVAELASIISSKVENAKAKAMLSRTKDKIRPPYAKAHREYLRRCIFTGTGNPGGVGSLRDPTGNRRYGPVRTGRIDAEWLADNRDQLLAEALRAYERGAKWWEMPAEAHAKAVERYQVRSVHLDAIRQHLLAADLHDGAQGGPVIVPPDVQANDDAGRWGNIVTPKRVIVQWLGVSERDASRMYMEISEALTQLGWRHKPTSIYHEGRKRSVDPWIVIDPTARYEARTGRLLVENFVHDRTQIVPNPF